MNLHELGGKSWNVLDLERHGFRVPKSLALTTAEVECIALGIDSGSVLEKVRAFYAEAELRTFAVRSSANLEDGAQHSFAGMFESYLRLETFEEIHQAIIDCNDSLKAPRVQEYCKNRGIPVEKLKMGVLIQELIPADWAGVTFTVDPMTGRESVMVMEFKEGLGDDLMDGKVTPRKFEFDWMTGESRVIQGTELPFDAKELGEICLRLQVLKQHPQDIEWAQYKGQFYVLQSRPITAIHVKASESWTNANMKDGGVASIPANPCVYSMYDYMINITMPTYFKKLGLLPREAQHSWVAQFVGNIYWSLTHTKTALQRIPGFIEREFDEGLGIIPKYAGKGVETKLSLGNALRALKILYKIKNSLHQRPQESRKIISSCEEVFRTTDREKMKLLSDEELSSKCSTLIEKHWFSIEGGYFYHIYDNSNCRSLFVKALESYNKKRAEPVSYLGLISEIDPLPHLNPLKELEEIAREIAGDAKALAEFTTMGIGDLRASYEKGLDYPGSRQINEFIYRNRFHSTREIDLLTPRWDEDPSQVYLSLKNLLANPQNLAMRAREESRTSEMDKIESAGLKRALVQHKNMLNMREELRICSVKTFYVVQTHWREMARRLVEAGLLKEENDIFFLSYNEGLELFKERRSETYQKKVTLNRQSFESFQKFKKPNEIYADSHPQDHQNQTDSTALRGVGCSAGVVEGVVFCATNFEEATRAPEGSILVTEFIDPSWTLSFINFKGVVTEAGGILSHGAAICREYGIPCVLSVPEALKHLRSGMKIRINGLEGTITVLSETDT